MSASRQPRSARCRHRDGQAALRRVPWWIAVAFLVGVAILWIYPFVWMLSASLKDNMEVFAAGLKLIPSSLHFENYVRAWEDANFGRYLINTVIVTLWTVFIVTVRCALCRLRAGTVSLPRLQNLHGGSVATLFVPTGYTIIPIVQVSLQLGVHRLAVGHDPCTQRRSECVRHPDLRRVFPADAEGARGSCHRRRRRLSPSLLLDHVAAGHAGDRHCRPVHLPGDLERVFPPAGVLLQPPGAADVECRHAGIRR